MKCNVGKTDKATRIIAGIIIGTVGFYFRSWWGLVAILPLVTAFAGFCPLYKLLGINTCKTKMRPNYSRENIE